MPGVPSLVARKNPTATQDVPETEREKKMIARLDTRSLLEG